MTFEEEFTLWYYGDGDGGYLRKEQRGDAKKAFAQARKIASLEDLVEGRKRHTAHHKGKGTEKKFIKLPAGWLRSEAWADEYEPEEYRPKEFWERQMETDRILRRVK